MKIITIAAGFFWIIQGCWAGSFLMPGGIYAADVQTAASQTVDGLVYTMPPGWVMQPVQAGPEIKAHYAFYYGDMPTGEMYLSQEPLAGPLSVEQYFQEGLAKVKPILAYYQHLNTQKVNLAGIETIVHEFSYAPAGAMFTARSYIMVVNNSGFNFFFQTASNYFPSMQSVFAQVMASVKAAPRPTPVPAPMPSGGMTVEEMGLVLRLPAGWGLSGDVAGAKYRMANARGRHVASLLILQPDQTSGLAAMFGETLGTVRRKIAGYAGLVHDFTCETAGQKTFYRCGLIAVKNKADTESVKYAAVVERCAFMAWDMERLEEFKAAFDAVIDSMRPKTEPGSAVEKSCP